MIRQLEMVIICKCHYKELYPVSGPDIPFRGGGGGHEMKMNAKGTVGSLGERKLIYNKIRTRKI